MKKFLFILVSVVSLMCIQAQANTWGPSYQVFPHGGTGVNTHDFITPATLANATPLANGHGYYNYNVEQPSSQQCIPQTTWTYFKFSVAPPRSPGGQTSGFVQYYRQDCP